MLTVLTTEFTHFNPVIRLSRVKHSPFFISHPVGGSVEQLAAVPGLTFYPVIRLSKVKQAPFFTSHLVGRSVTTGRRTWPHQFFRQGKPVVHPIREDSNSRLLPICGWTDHGPVMGTTHDSVF